MLAASSSDRYFSVYINHRPAFGLEADKLDWVFNTLGIPIGDGKPAIERGEMLDILQKNGMFWGWGGGGGYKSLNVG